MKKTVLLTFCVALCICLCILGGCNKQNASPSGIEKYVSCYYDKVFTAVNDNFSISLIGGKREKTISVDGNVGTLTDFCTLTVSPKKSNLCNNQYTYTLCGTKGNIDGNLAKDVLGVTFSAEIANFEKVGELQKIVIACTDILSEELQTANKLEGRLGWKAALEKAQEELGDNIASETDTGNLGREIYVKLVSAPDDTDSPHYWYVSFIKSPSDYWAVLLDTQSGVVLSRRK